VRIDLPCASSRPPIRTRLPAGSKPTDPAPKTNRRATPDEVPGLLRPAAPRVGVPQPVVLVDQRLALVEAGPLLLLADALLGRPAAQVGLPRLVSGVERQGGRERQQQQGARRQGGRPAAVPARPQPRGAQLVRGPGLRRYPRQPAAQVGREVRGPLIAAGRVLLERLAADRREVRGDVVDQFRRRGRSRNHVRGQLL
jgi:hypothetical protein